MGLTLGERRAVTRRLAARYAKACKAEKSKILDELCALCEWNRDHARRALRRALEPPRPRRKPARRPTYGEDALRALRVVWAALDGPSGKRLSPVMGEMLEVLERCGELIGHEPF